MSYRESHDLLFFWQQKSVSASSFVLATLARTEGATYRKAGAKKIIAADGAARGLLSGGCLEGAITKAALEFLEGTGAGEVCFDTSHESDRLLGYQKGCRGKIWVSFSKLEAHTTARAQEIFAELFQQRRSVVYGAGPDALPMSELLTVMRWPHIVVDHRKDLLVPENFSGARELIYEAPTTSARHARPGDAVLLMSHNYEADLNILKDLALKSQATAVSYLGILGPPSRFQQLRADLKAFFGVQWPPHLEAVTHAPVGLNLGCNDPHDIALSVIAELLQERIFAPHQQEPIRPRNLDFSPAAP